MPTCVQQPVSFENTTMQQPVDPEKNEYQDELSRNCFNIQWLLFVLGWLLLIPSIVGIFLPLCNGRSRFPTRSYLIGWIANIVLSVLLVIIIIVASVVATRIYYSDSQLCYSVYYASYYNC